MILANKNINKTVLSLQNFPRLYKWKKSELDSIRAYDLKANDLRDRIKLKSKSYNNYFKQLETKIIFNINNKSQIDRIVELSKKTNQFNFSNKRLNSININNFLNSRDNCIVTITLNDKLSNSGVIAIVIAKKIARNKSIINELCISCRALGRNLKETF